MWPKELWIIFLVCLAFSSVGWYQFVWFMSVGYGLAVCAASITILIMFHNTLTVSGILLCLAMAAYGFRLGGFLLIRAVRNQNYRKKLAQTAAASDIPAPVKAVMWIFVSAMYVMQTSPVFFRGYNNTDSIWGWIGLFIMIFGAGMEALADKQKSDQKKINPDRWADQGLYRIVRCPNYLGEMLFWTGVLVSGIECLSGSQWVFPVIGWILLIYVMMAGARRLELRHEKNYGDQPDYRSYASSVPLILPFIPLYSLKKAAWLKG